MRLDEICDLTLQGTADLELAKRVLLGDGVWGRLAEGREPMPWSKVATPCAKWTASKVNGYPKFKHRRERGLVHRAVYELFVGPIPQGFEVDHLCGCITCCRPDHLEVVTKAEHRRRHAARNVYMRATEVGLEPRDDKDYVFLRLPDAPRGAMAEPQYRRMPRFSC
jgi:hypothetical protein